MTMQTSTPLTGDLTERAMLVDLTVHQWAAVKHDRKIDRFVATHHNTDEDAGRYVKRLGKGSAPGALLAKVRAKAGQLYDEHRRRTLPWQGGGTRILPSAGYLEYVRVMGDLIAEYDVLADQFTTVYPDMIEADRARMNGLFNERDYPAPGHVRNKFGVSYHVAPVPSASDFRVTMSAMDLARCRASIEADRDAALAAAMTSVWERVKDVVGKMANRLQTYSTDGEKATGVFRDSLVGHVRDLVDVLPTLNITNDPDLAAFTNRMRDELLTYDADTLRESLAARRSTAAAAQEILDRVSDFI